MNKHGEEFGLLSVAMVVLVGLAAWVSRLNDTSVSVGAISVVFFSYMGLSLLIPLAMILVVWRIKVVVQEIVSTRIKIGKKVDFIIDMLLTREEGELNGGSSYGS